MDRRKVSTVIISDIHVGSEHAKVRELISFLHSIDCEKLILNDDILDGWKLQRNPFGRWKQEYTDLVKVIMKMMENHNTRVIYVRGNHDSFLDRILPFNLSSVSFVEDYIHVTHGKRYYVTHGDMFDHISSHMIWLAKVGDYGYTFLLWINKVLNGCRRRSGKPYYSYSWIIKHKVKSAVSYISDFERALTDIAGRQHYDGVICGHIHQPADIWFGKIRYLNSGDWVESLSALIESEDGSWEVFKYEENCSEEVKVS